MRPRASWLDDPHRKQFSLTAVPQLAASLPALNSDRQDRVADLKTCIHHLPLKLREVIELRYGGGRVTYKDMAALLGVSESLVNKRLTAARKQLRDWMEGEDWITSGREER